MISVDELQKSIISRVDEYLNIDNPLVSRQRVVLALNDALNHILAVDINANLDIPRQNVSAMDGFALVAQSQLQQGDGFTVIGESCAGTPFNGEILPNQAVRIFTGAVVPEGCDTVVMQEHTTFDQINHLELV